MNNYFVYIMSSLSRRLYVGVTNNLERRAFEHKKKLIPGFTAQYNMTRLVCYETYTQVRDAIGREKQIKGWLRAKKVQLIESINPTWQDLSEQWLESRDSSLRSE